MGVCAFGGGPGPRSPAVRRLWHPGRRRPTPRAAGIRGATKKKGPRFEGYESNPYFEVCNFGFWVGSGFFVVF